MNNHQHPDGNTTAPFWRRKTGVVLIMLIAIGAFYVLREHFIHVDPVWPYLILVICALMHFFRHGHGEHSHGDQATTHKDEKGK